MFVDFELQLVEQLYEGRLKSYEFTEYQLEFPPFDSIHEQCQSRYCTTSAIYAALVDLVTVAVNDEFLIATATIGIVSSLTVVTTTTVIVLLNDEPSAIAVALRIIIVIV